MVDQPRFACLSRFYKGELPYLYAFVRHYLGLGFETIYLVLQSEELIAEADVALAELCGDVSYILVPPALNPDSVLDDLALCVRDRVREDYLLHVDCDEFLRLPYAWTIDHYVAQLRWPVSIVFQWVMVCADVDPASQLRRGFYGCNSKQMARTDCIQGFQTPHRFLLKPSQQQPSQSFATGSGADGAFLVHYWSRGFNDILIRCIHGGAHPGPRSSSHAEVLQHIANATLPGRLKVLACFMRHDHYYLVDNYLAAHLDVEREEALLVPWLTQSQRAELLRLYVDYRQGLDIDRDVAPFPVIRKINANWLRALP